jgi:hypothetical protein
MSNNNNVVFRFKWPEKTAVSSFRTSETTFQMINFHIFSRASDCILFSINFTSDLSLLTVSLSQQFSSKLLGFCLSLSFEGSGSCIRYWHKFKIYPQVAMLRRKPQSAFCVSVRPWLHSDIHMWGSVFLDPEDIRKLNIGAIWNFAEGTGLR